ncbi:exonuclease domain-containing protein [Brachybacterium phenoliresistens]|uniref:exonuclease domain-containing protein n=1 Tax=Brachybacterium phenoliresistens TaxID=396014 RepID=UPI0031E3AA8A
MENSPHAAASTLDFTAIDFETANPRRASVCSVGLAKVRGGEVVDTLSLLVSPPEWCDEFAAMNVRIHGITAGTVAGAPSWERAFGQVMAFIGDDDLLAHNAAFDRSVMEQACSAYDLDWPELAWFDSLAFARGLLTLGSYSLPFVAKALELEEFDHHDAGADALQAARVAIALAARVGAGSLADLASRASVHARPQRATGGSGRAHATEVGETEPRDLDSLSSASLLEGETIVFTGTLSLSTRAEATALVERFGATTQTSVTKKTTILVTGDFTPQSLRPGATMSSKLIKALALAEKGQRLELLTEDDLHARLDLDRAALEAATRAQRASARGGWLPSYVVDQARSQSGETENYTAWLRAALRHPEGRATATDSCIRCDGPFADDVYWMFLERRVCSPDCNEALKRAAKRAWAGSGIVRPAAPSYAESYGRRSETPGLP